MSWHADIANGHQWLAYCGGGGSAKTGVKNQIVILYDGGETKRIINTGDEVALAIELYQTGPARIQLIASLGREVVHYVLEGDNEPRPSGSVTLQDDTGDLVNAISLNSSLDRMALACEKGDVLVYGMQLDASSAPFSPEPLYALQGHAKAVCAVKFSQRNNRLVSSSKDGTAKVWNAATGTLIQTLTCQIQKVGAPPRTGQSKQIIVRGCAFGDMDGASVLTVASGRKFDAFLTRWVPTQADGTDYQMAQHTFCSPKPVTSMSVSKDDRLLIYGAVDGTVTVFNLESWKTLRSFREVHELPVTCVAARPLHVPDPFRGEVESGVIVHAISASADSKLALLTLQRRAPRKKGSGGSGFGFLDFVFQHSILSILVLAVVASVARESWKLCIDPIMVAANRPYQNMAWWDTPVLQATKECIVDEVLWTPPERLPFR